MVVLFAEVALFIFLTSAGFASSRAIVHSSVVWCVFMTGWTMSLAGIEPNVPATPAKIISSWLGFKMIDPVDASSMGALFDQIALMWIMTCVIYIKVVGYGANQALVSESMGPDGFSLNTELPIAMFVQGSTPEPALIRFALGDLAQKADNVLFRSSATLRHSSTISDPYPTQASRP